MPLTQVVSNAQVSLPIVADDRFTLSREQLEDISSGLSGSSAQSALDGLIDRFVNRFVSVLELTRWLFIAYAGIFVIIVLEGLAGFVCEFPARGRRGFSCRSCLACRLHHHVLRSGRSTITFSQEAPSTTTTDSFSLSL